MGKERQKISSLQALSTAASCLAHQLLYVI
jgi:hypothetical protein